MLTSEGAEHGVSSELLTGNPSGRPCPRGALQKYLRKICRTRSPFDGVRGLHASLWWDSVTKSFPWVSKMS
jgi:hypothetical protein